jgi:chromosome partitioning protein
MFPFKGGAMPRITAASSKGGVGKSTSMAMLAFELSKGAKTILLDGDPNHPICNWAGKWLDPKDPKVIKVSENLEVWRVDPEDDIVDLIEEAAQKAPFVITDTEGVADLRVANAISVSDFVIIPSQGSFLDQAGAASVIKLIRGEERKLKRPIPFAVVLTKVDAAIRTRVMADAEKKMADYGIDVFETRIVNRQAFQAMFSFQTTLDGLNSKQVSNIDKAQDNARAFAQEVITRLKSMRA